MRTPGVIEERVPNEGLFETRSRPGHLLAMGLILLAVTVLQLYTSPDLEALHLLYRRLYYVPILYAAFIFGLRGGLPMGIGASILLALVAFQDPGGVTVADSINEMAMYIILGGLFGWMRDIESHQHDNVRQMSRRLEDAYVRLEERAVEVLTIQEYTNAILQSITAGVLTVGPDGSVTTANKAAEQFFGLSERDMVPHKLQTMLQEDGGLQSEVDKVLGARVPRSMRDLLVRTRDGREVHANVTVARMRDLDDNLIGAVVTLEDVSEVKALTDQLIRADRLAALGELTAGVAHEVRNPLGIIRATVQLLDDQEYSPQRAVEAGRIITQEVDRLDRVIKALLDFGRPWSPTLMRISVNRLIEEVVLFTQKWAGRSDVDITVRYGEDIPETLADPHQLKQVFVNLISNAVQAMEDGGKLEITTSAGTSYVSIRFQDNGPGMDPETANKVFDPFFSTREDGTGLGLTIVHRIVDEHGGHIEVMSRPGQGTAFTIHLPVRQYGPAPERDTTSEGIADSGGE